MPELPEVETVVRALEPQLVGRAITGVRVVGKPLRQAWCDEWSRQLRRKHAIQQVRRRGKWIIVDLDSDQCLLFHLGMTGRLHLARRRSPLLPHTHLVFALHPGREELRFQDVRRFGLAQLLTQGELLGRFSTESLGPEPEEVRTEWLRNRLNRTTRCLKAILLDQQVVAGVGNIYADEALFEARLHPARKGCDLKPAEVDRLRRAIVAVIDRAIEKKGSTIRDFIFGENGRGSYQDEFRVYGRTGEPCPRCKTPIQQIRLAGRSSHFCSRCQAER